MSQEGWFDDLEARLGNVEADNLRLRQELAQVVHDARGHLANLGGFVQLLLVREGARLSPEAQRYAAHVLGAVGELNALLNRLADDRVAPDLVAS